MVQLRDHAETVALIEGALDAVVDKNFDLVEHLIRECYWLNTFDDEQLNRLLTLINKAKNENNTGR